MSFTHRGMTIATLLILAAGLLPAAAAAKPPKPAPGAALVPVRAGQSVSGIDASLRRTDKPKGKLVGRFVWAGSGKPAPGSDRGLKLLVFDRHRTQVLATRDWTPKFSLRLPAGRYAFCFRGQGIVARCLGNVLLPNEALPRGAKFVRVSAGRTKHLGTIRVRMGGRIVGTVRDIAGHGMATDVYARSLSDPKFFRFGFTDAGDHNRYRLTGLLPSPKGYAVCFSGDGYPNRAPANRSGYEGSCLGGATWNSRYYHPPLKGTPLHVRPGQTKRGIDGTLRIAGGIRGTIYAKDTGAKLPNIRISIFDRSGRIVQSVYNNGRSGYVVGSLLPGHSYRVCALPEHASYYGRCYRGAAWRGGSSATGKKVHVTRGKLRTVNFRLAPAGTIAGIVRSSSGNRDGMARVYVYTAGGKQVRSTRVRQYGDVGTYRVHRLAPRPRGYVVCVRDIGNQGKNRPPRSAPSCYGDKAWDGPRTPIPAGAQRVRVRNGHTTSGIDVRLAPGGAIGGTIRDARSHKAVKALVRVYRADGTLVQQQRGFESYWFTGLSASSTGYRVCFGEDSHRYNNGRYAYVGQCWRRVAWHH